jgi:signal transduction histidine kinase
MAMAFHKKYWAKYFNRSLPLKPTGQGTGLGLSISYDIVKAHGGELKVETKEGKGQNSLFNYRLNKIMVKIFIATIIVFLSCVTIYSEPKIY